MIAYAEKQLILILAVLLIAGPGLAEICAGQTMAANTLCVAVEEGESILKTRVFPGEKVCAGDVLADLATTCVFAGQSGTVARVYASAGDQVDGAVLELAPVYRYEIYCTVSGAYSAAENMLIHSGETLYVRCTADGSHRAVGTVSQIDGGEYHLYVTGGELYVGETVNLYRDPDFSSTEKVGKGTVVSSDTETYVADGTMLRACVKAGEYVERGELLYEYAAGDRDALLSPVDGIVVDIRDAGIVIAPFSEICVETQVGEKEVGRLKVGDIASLVYAADMEECAVSGTIVQILSVVENGFYTVRIAPESPPERLGLTVEIRLP